MAAAKLGSSTSGVGPPTATVSTSRSMFVQFGLSKLFNYLKETAKGGRFLENNYRNS
jgi:hypothetical protein